MKKIILYTLISVATVVGFAQNKRGDIIKSGEQYFIYLSEFRTPEVNEEFQRNLSIIQAQNAQLKQIKDRIASSQKEEEKLYLQATMKKLENEYKANEKIMGQAYGFASNRTYKQIYFKSNLCVILTKEEIAQLKMNNKIGRAHV